MKPTDAKAIAYAIELQKELAAACAKARDTSKPEWKRIRWQQEAQLLARSCKDVAYLTMGYTLADLGLDDDSREPLFF